MITQPWGGKEKKGLCCFRQGGSGQKIMPPRPARMSKRERAVGNHSPESTYCEGKGKRRNYSVLRDSGEKGIELKSAPSFWE